MRCQHWQRGFAWRIEGKRRVGRERMHINITACCMWALQKIQFSYLHSRDLPARDAHSPLIAFKVSCCKFLHEPVNFLGLSGEPKALQEHSQCRNKIFALEVHLINVGVHHLLIEAVIIPEEFSHLSLREQKAEASLILTYCNVTYKLERDSLNLKAVRCLTPLFGLSRLRARHSRQHGYYCSSTNAAQVIREKSRGRKLISTL